MKKTTLAVRKAGNIGACQKTSLSAKDLFGHLDVM